MQTQFRHLPVAAHQRDAGRSKSTIVRSTEKPTGVGEPGVPPIGPAVANAMARLGLGRPRQLPCEGSGVMTHAAHCALRLPARLRRAAVHAVAASRSSQPRLRRSRDIAAGLGFNNIADTRRALGRAVRGGRQGAQHPRCVNCHPAATGRCRPTRMRPHQPLVVRGADGHGAPALHARPVTTAPISIRRACPAIRNGIWRRSRWRGRASRSARSASRSRTRRAMAARTSPPLSSISADDTLVGWGWNPGAGRTPAPGTQGVRRADEGLGRHRRALPG